MRQAMVRHDALVEGIVAQHGGRVVRPRGEGDSRFAVFARASDAVAAVADAQRALHGEPWPTPDSLRVRAALRGQTLLSQATHAVVRDEPLPDIAYRDLGEHRLKDLAQPERIYQL